MKCLSFLLFFYPFRPPLLLMWAYAYIPFLMRKFVGIFQNLTMANPQCFENLPLVI